MDPAERQAHVENLHHLQFCAKQDAGVIHAPVPLPGQPHPITHCPDCQQVIRTKLSRSRKQWYRIDYRHLEPGITSGQCDGCDRRHSIQHHNRVFVVRRREIQGNSHEDEYWMKKKEYAATRSKQQQSTMERKRKQRPDSPDMTAFLDAIDMDAVSPDALNADLLFDTQQPEVATQVTKKDSSNMGQAVFGLEDDTTNKTEVVITKKISGSDVGLTLNFGTPEIAQPLADDAAHARRECEQRGTFSFQSWTQKVEYICPRPNCQRKVWSWRIVKGVPCLRCMGFADIQNEFEEDCRSISDSDRPDQSGRILKLFASVFQRMGLLRLFRFASAYGGHVISLWKKNKPGVDETPPLSAQDVESQRSDNPLIVPLLQGDSDPLYNQEISETFGLADFPTVDGI